MYSGDFRAFTCSYFQFLCVQRTTIRSCPHFVHSVPELCESSTNFARSTLFQTFFMLFCGKLEPIMNSLLEIHKILDIFAFTRIWCLKIQTRSIRVQIFVFSTHFSAFTTFFLILQLLLLIVVTA